MATRAACSGRLQQQEAAVSPAALPPPSQPQVGGPNTYTHSPVRVAQLLLRLAAVLGLERPLPGGQLPALLRLPALPVGAVRQRVGSGNIFWRGGGLHVGLVPASMPACTAWCQPPALWGPGAATATTGTPGAGCSACCCLGLDCSSVHDRHLLNADLVGYNTRCCELSSAPWCKDKSTCLQLPG